MATMTLGEVKKSLCGALGAPTVDYDEALDRFTLMSIFFKALGRLGPAALVDGVKKALPGAEILNVWTERGEEGSHAGVECVAFRI